MRLFPSSVLPSATPHVFHRITGLRLDLLWLATFLLTGVSVSVRCDAQEGPVTFEFSFSNPGARSMAMGGAFAALADDATAAFANPAGLQQLLEPELSVEFRQWSYDTRYVAGGRAAGVPTGEGIDTVSGLRTGNSSADLTGLSFASYTYPGKRWSFAVYQHTWANFELVSEVDGLFADGDEGTERSEDVRSQSRVKVENTGLAASFAVSERLSLGLGLVRFQGTMNSFSAEYAPDEDDLFASHSFAPELLDTTYSHTADSSGFVVHAGILVRPSERWSLGAFYRQGPELDLRVVEITGPADDESPEGTVDLDTVTPLHLPDSYGVGVSYRALAGALTLSGEWTRVRYSQITRSLNVNVFDPDLISIDDGDELHFGLEYVFVGSRPIVALRLGAWRDPAHSVGPGPAANVFEAAIFRGGSDETHLTGGLGLAFPRFQIDLGADLSEETDLYSLSFVYRF